MTNLAQIFGEYNQVTVRWNEDPTFPIWVAQDVCNALEISRGRDAIKDFDNDEKGAVTISTLGGKQEMVGVTEAGLYRLIFKSRKTGAKAFQRWVFHEVLPQIRKTGVFNTVPFKLHDDSALVSFEGDDYWVTTLKIAELFEKEHYNVIRDFNQALEDYYNALKFEGINLPNFKKQDSFYIDSKGRTQECYKVNRALFNYVVLGYQGRKAKLYRMSFIKAFEDLERKIKVYMAQQMIYNNPKRQQVYILKNETTELIKIGVTNDIERRKKELENASGCEISVVYLSPLSDNTRSLERELHQEFQEYRLVGEWFNLNSERVIESLERKELVINPTDRPLL